ncbi:MAG: thiamine phosphate synthase, partial [Methylomonas sp.]
LQKNVKFIQLRIKSLPKTDIRIVLLDVLAICQDRQVKLLINSDLELGAGLGDGVHLSSRALSACRIRPQGHAWVAASCHNLMELKYAEQLGVDFAVLASIQASATHPGQEPLGWETAIAWIDQVNIPVYVMGGLALTDLPKAFAAGAQGLAGISAFLADG